MRPTGVETQPHNKAKPSTYRGRVGPEASIPND
jgi:hypothetical protein